MIIELENQGNTCDLEEICPSTSVQMDEFNHLTIARFPGITELRPSNPGSNEDVVHLLGHPSDDEVIEWWRKDLARPPEERMAGWDEMIDFIKSVID